MDLFNQIIKEEMNIKLLKPVPVYVAADTENYRRVLSGEFKLSKDELPEWSDSTGFSTYSGVAMDASKNGMHNSKDRCFVTSHELFHQLQYAIMGGNRSENPRYFQEGTAELIGARVAEQFGFTSVQDWSKEIINQVRTTAHPATVQELSAADEFDEWHKLIDKDKHPYGVSSLIVISLFDLSKKDVYKGISDYFIQIGCGKNIDSAFMTAFGISYKKFLEDFDAWYAAAVSKPAEIEIVSDRDVPDTLVAETKQAFAATQLFLKDSWGAPMKTSPRIILSSDQPSGVSILGKEFGMEISRANELFANGKSFPFYWDGSTALVNLRDASVRESLTFATASIFLRMYLYDISSLRQAEGAFWLFIGGGDLSAALITQRNGGQNLYEQKKTWLEIIRKASPAPQLDRLRTQKEWEEAYNRHGRTNLYALVRLAALYLSETYGYKSLTDWYSRIMEEKNAEKSFEKIFKIPLSRFEQNFLNYLREQMKLAAS
jgi:hypothetical protein